MDKNNISMELQIVIGLTASVTSPSSILTPPTLASNAIPTEHSELLAVAATSPAQRVPCRFESVMS